MMLLLLPGALRVAISEFYGQKESSVLGWPRA